MKYSETPVIEVREGFFDPGIRLLVKREDMNHPNVSGNKWWKLQGNIEMAKRQEKTTLLTFGGAFSNHIVATAGAAKESGLKSVGIIRGEKVLPLNSSLSFAEKMGMELNFISRDEYRRKDESVFLNQLSTRFPNCYIIPEGGTNEEAILNVARWAKKLEAEIDFDVVCLPVGTGGTMAGIIKGLEGKKYVIGVAALKGDFLTAEVNRWLDLTSPENHYKNWHIESTYHLGGYAKSNVALGEFIASAWQNHQLPLEPVYTGKLFYGVYDLIRKKKFKSPCSILVIHTGGLESMRTLSE